MMEDHVLKNGHCLKGRDVVPVVLRLQALQEEPDNMELACFSKKYKLDSYSSEELAREFFNLTGHNISVSTYIYIYLICIEPNHSIIVSL